MDKQESTRKRELKRSPSKQREQLAQRSRGGRERKDLQNRKGTTTAEYKREGSKAQRYIRAHSLRPQYSVLRLQYSVLSLCAP